MKLNAICLFSETTNNVFERPAKIYFQIFELVKFVNYIVVINFYIIFACRDFSIVYLSLRPKTNSSISILLFKLNTRDFLNGPPHSTTGAIDLLVNLHERYDIYKFREIAFPKCVDYEIVTKIIFIISLYV